MNFNMPMAVFGGLALIAAAIYFGPGSHSVTAQSGGVQKVVLCDEAGKRCAPESVYNWSPKGSHIQKVEICDGRTFVCAEVFKQSLDVTQ